MKYLILLFLSQIAQADDWFCKTQHAKKEGNIYWVCGTGMGLQFSPETGRFSAFSDAQRNFEALCNSSNDCKGHKININPKRTECVPDPNSYIETCYQMVEVTVLN